MNETAVKPKVERTESGLWSWVCECSKSGMLGLHDQLGTFLKARDHARQYHGHHYFSDLGGGWWIRECKICDPAEWAISNVIGGKSWHHELSRALDKADQHYRRYHDERHNESAH